MRKSLSGMVAVVVLLGCWSQSEAGDGTTAKLMADRKVAQAAEWILYDEVSEDSEIVTDVTQPVGYDLSSLSWIKTC